MNNQTIVAVERIEDLNPRHVACLKFLASSSPSGAKSMRKISDMPKIIKGTDIPQFRGNFVLIRAKLVNLQHGGKRGPSKGRVVCGDGAPVHFSCVPFLLRNNTVKLGDQVVMIGKVNQNNKRSTQTLTLG
ncbi:uncharacterized protein LOC134820651 [Bolinopsis microptera]|uniref:uncharacterized protein LOC134820651 n=1 Tax=Bolinopsis microptera TaxID=2820187 RepID=UPI00307AC6E1